MNQNQIDYIRENFPKKTVRQIARELGVRRQEVQMTLEKTGKAPLEPETSSGLSDFKKYLWMALLAVLLTGIVYARTLSYPFVKYDDPKYVTTNQLIQNVTAEKLKAIFERPYFSMYIPLTLLSYAADYHFYGDNPTGYRITTLTLHLLNVFLIFWILRRITGSAFAALGVSLIFGLHPVQVESVVWIAERKNVLSTFFALLSILCHLGFRTSGPPRERYYILSFLFFMIGCLCKPNVIVIPVILFLYDWTHGFISKESSPQEGKLPYSFGRYFPYLSGGAIIALTTILVVQDTGKLYYHGGSFIATLKSMTVVLMKYLGLLLVPLNQSLIYAFQPNPAWSDPPVILSTAGVIASAAFLVVIYKRNRRLFFWAAWYVVFLLPMMNLIPFPSLMNDRYLYVPMVGFFGLLICFLETRIGRRGFLILLVTYAAVLSVLNVRRQNVWADPERLWQETRASIKDANWGAAVHNNLALTYLDDKKYKEAEEEILKALKLNPDQAVYHNTYGTILSALGRNRQARREVRRALEIDSEFSDALYNMGKLTQLEGSLDETEVYWSQLLAREPYYQRSGEIREFLERRAEARAVKPPQNE